MAEWPGERVVKRFCRLGAGASSEDVGEEDVQHLRFCSAFGHRTEA